jgi:hypothetical protein
MLVFERQKTFLKYGEYFSVKNDIFIKSNIFNPELFNSALKGDL